MLGVFISSFDEVSKQVFKDFTSFVEVSPRTLENSIAALAEILKDQDMDIKQICRPKLIRYPGNFQPALLLAAPFIWHSRVCFKHLINEYPWLQSVDSLLPGLWKTIHYSSKYRFILCEIKEACGMKSVKQQ